ncbi:MAG: biotin transporter BioY, partial [Thermoanaerobaculia bacterium]|nr:biotin transporter BioY [Thermoanaerobaculia bacterium]
ARGFAFAGFGMAFAHCLLLFIGWLGLSKSLGFERAFSLGVAPFWIGALVKSAVAAVILVGVVRREPARIRIRESPAS